MYSYPFLFLFEQFQSVMMPHLPAPTSHDGEGRPSSLSLLLLLLLLLLRQY
jgi:hypothetical protein